MTENTELKTCDLSFTRGTIYKDLRSLGGNAYRDIKTSLSLGTSSDLVYLLKNKSNLLKSCDGNESVKQLTQGVFSAVYMLEDKRGRKLIIKRSHDKRVPLQLSATFHIPIPRWVTRLFFDDYDICSDSLRRDVQDYETIIKPYWGIDRKPLVSEHFIPFLNMILYMVDSYIPDFDAKDIYRMEFWEKLLKQKKHPKLNFLLRYIRSVKPQKSLIPEEERYIFFDEVTKSLQTIFVQEAMSGKEEILPGRYNVYPFELVAEGIFFHEMPELMIEHFLRMVDIFRIELQKKIPIPKVLDFRPMATWRSFAPSPPEFYIAETNNLVAFKTKDGTLNISLVDTHILLDPQSSQFYKWMEKRYWTSLLLSLRFWVRKAIETVE